MDVFARLGEGDDADRAWRPGDEMSSFSGSTRESKRTEMDEAGAGSKLGRR